MAVLSVFTSALRSFAVLRQLNFLRTVAQWSLIIAEPAIFPDMSHDDFELDVKQDISKGAVVPMPCLDKSKKEGCAECAKASKNFSDQLERLADAINDGKLSGATKADMEQFLKTNDL